jgi:hypothetical protein
MTLLSRPNHIQLMPRCFADGMDANNWHGHVPYYHYPKLAQGTAVMLDCADPLGQDGWPGWLGKDVA